MLTPFGRKLKQINILFGWLIFLLGIAAFIWFLVAKPKPVGKIESLKIENVQATLKTKEKAWQPPFTFTVVADILNPNNKFSATKINYKFEITDKDQKVITQKEGETKVLGGEKKTIQEEITINTSGQNLNFQVTDTKWEQIANE